MRARISSFALLAALCAVTLLALLPSAAPKGHAQGGQAIALSSGFRHSCIATTAGAVKCWGNAGQGRLGDGQQGQNQVTPVDATAAPGGVVSLAAGWGHTCALTLEGAPKCWGNNFRGALGNGTETNSFTAVDVCANAACTAPLTGALEIAAGDRHNCARMPGGGLKCWGSNTQGQLGDGQACDDEACPYAVDVQGLAGKVVSLSAGISHTCAVITTGQVQCWGLNATGQLGNGTTEGSALPVTVQNLTNAIAVATGGEHTCAITTAGGVKCWGRNADGQLGDAQVCGASVCATPVDVVGLSGGVARLALGEAFSCAVTQAGALRCWGDNSEGQLGDSQACGFDCTTPVDPIGLDSGVIAVDGGAYHVCALLDSGTVQCMGANGSGQLGDGMGGDFDDRSTVPVTVVGLGAADSDGDTVGDVADADDDNDGCPDVRELSANPALGGQRSPKVFWDFFDTPAPGQPRDQAVSVGDVFRIVGRFGLTGDPGIDPLSTPPDTGYHTAFDRSPPDPGRAPWNLNAPDGSIAVNDILLAVVQFGHTCA